MKKKFRRTKLYRFITSNDKRKRLIVASIGLFFVSFMSIGFAYLSETLELSGNVTVGTDAFVLVNNIVVEEMVSGGVNTYSPTYNKNTITLTSTLPNLDSSVTYKITFKNYSPTNIAEVESIVKDSLSNENVIYTITGLDVSNTISTGATAEALITFKYKTELTELPENKDVGAIITYNFKIHEEATYEYVAGNMLLNLRGIDAPIGNDWYDAQNGRDVKLTNVTYDNNEFAYVFNGNSFGTLGEAIIPETGDFTLELRATFPNNIKSVVDQAIVSQLSDTSNDKGRFKFGAYYSSGASQFRMFVNNAANTNPSITFIKNPTPNNPYLLQLVRSGEQLKLYVDGILATTVNFSSTEKISQGPFKIGKWNNASTQYYSGKINAVRLYKNALTDEEIIFNRDVDRKYYVPEEHKTLKGYAISTQVVSSGDGLYPNSLNGYSYRGANPNNYLKFFGNDEVFRIISFNEDGSMKLVSSSTKLNVPFDETGNRDLTSTYCIDSETTAEATNTKQKLRGCNAWAKTIGDATFTNGKTTGTVLKDATINTYLNTTYYNTISTSIKNKILTHDFNIGLAVSGKSADELLTLSTLNKWSGKVGLITLAEMLDASLNRNSISSENTATSSYINNKQTAGDIYWLMTAKESNTFDIYVSAGTSSIGSRRASRYDQAVGTTNYTMYALPAFYFDSEIESYSGTGYQTDPFIIN